MMVVFVGVTQFCLGVRERETLGQRKKKKGMEPGVINEV